MLQREAVGASGALRWECAMQLLEGDKPFDHGWYYVFGRTQYHI